MRWTGGGVTLALAAVHSQSIHSVHSRLAHSRCSPLPPRAFPLAPCPPTRFFPAPPRAWTQPGCPVPAHWPRRRWILRRSIDWI